MAKANWGSKLAFAGAVLAMAVGLSGCAGFFVKPTDTSGGGSGGTTVTGDFAYVSNSVSGSTYLAEYNLSAGTLAPITGSPVSLGYTPLSMAVAPSNAFLYAASASDASSPGIYLYSIASTGALTIANNGAPLVSDTVASIAISPDGGWLFSLNVTGLVMYEYQVNTSTGALTLATSFVLPGLGCGLTTGGTTPASQTCTVTAGPSGAYVALSLGTQGTIVFPFASSGGITTASYTQIPSGTTSSNPTGDFSVALDKNNYAYIARTSTLGVYAITSSTAGAAATLQATATFAGGTVPRSPVLASTYNYVYTAGQGTGGISGFSIGTSGALTEVAGSPFTGPTNVAVLGADNSGKYILAAGYASSGGVQLYTIGTTGGLTATASAASGTVLTYPAVLALTH